MRKGYSAGYPDCLPLEDFRGASGCGGEKVCPKSNLEFYIGWMEDREGTSINVDADQNGQTVGLGLNAGAVRHRFANRGLWLGLSDTICINDKLSFIASGWYLVPSTTNSRQEYFINGVQLPTPLLDDNSWHVKPQWWYVDGLFAIGSPCSGLTLLAGLRFDYYILPASRIPTVLLLSVHLPILQTSLQRGGYRFWVRSTLSRVPWGTCWCALSACLHL